MANTKITNPELFNLGDSTSATQLPVMTTTQRIDMTGLSVGEMIFNSDTDKVEYWDGTKWYGITYEVAEISVDYLVVAGGGAGGHSYGASGSGGGAGEFLYKTSQTLTTGSLGYSVIVGAGSLAQIGGAGYPDFAPNGGDSTFNLDVTNGGAGGANSAAYNPGASGGSGSGGVLARIGGTSVKTAGGLGNNGGTGSLTASGYGSGGGGGALTAGARGGGAVGGNGGDGETNSITGTPVVYSAGGGGGRYLGNNAQGGSSGIGGNPTSGTPTTPTNYGCGGAGGSYASGIAQQGGNASNGVVILRYPAAYTASSTLTYSDTIVPGSTDRVIVITGTGTGTVTFA